MTAEVDQAVDASPTVTRTPGEAALYTPPPTRTPRPDPTATLPNIQVLATTEPTETATVPDEPTETPTDEPEPTDEPTEEPAATLTEKPTRTPRPTRTPSEEPTEIPTDEPMATATDEPTATPTDEPTETPEPTEKPTETPTEEPTNTPRPTRTLTATEEPTGEPTITGTPRIVQRTPAGGQDGDTSNQETDDPTVAPTDEPIEEPMKSPTEEQTEEPTDVAGQPTIGPANTEPTESSDTSENSNTGEGNGSNGDDNSGPDDGDGNRTGNSSEGSGDDNGEGGNSSGSSETTGIGSAGNETGGDDQNPEETPTEEPVSPYENADDLGDFPEALGATTGFQFSSTGLFVYTDGGTITIGDGDGNRVASLGGSHPIWSPFGAVLLYQLGNEVMIWDRDTGETSSISAATGDGSGIDLAAGWVDAQLQFVRLFPDEGGRAEFHTTDWNGANDVILGDGQLSDIVARPVTTTAGVWIVTSDGWVLLDFGGGFSAPRANPWGRISDPIASPFGSVLAFVTGDGVLRIVTADNPEIAFSAPIPDGGAGFAFAPDGATIVVANGNGLALHDMQSGSLIGQREGDAVAAPGWGPSGIYAVTQGQDPRLIRFAPDALLS